MIRLGGSILICGPVTMAEGLRKSLTKLISQRMTQLDLEKANDYFEELVNEERYIEEIYGTSEA